MDRPRARRDLLVAGHVNVDHYLGLERFPEADRTVPVARERVELGGTAANLALVARRYGLRVGLLSRVGAGFPSSFRAALRGAGVDLRGLETLASYPTPTCTIVEDNLGGTRTLIQQGPMGARRRARTPAWLREYRWIHLGTGDPEEYLELARWARANRQHVAVDPAQEIFYRWDRRTFRSMLPFAEVLLGNRAEIEVAAAWTDAGGIGGLLHDLSLVVRTDGRTGATAFWRGGSVHAPARRPARLRTLVGAGDAFRGGFYAGWLGGKPLAACLRTGNEAARARIEGRLRPEVGAA